MTEFLASTILANGQYGYFTFSYDWLFVLSLGISILIVVAFSGPKFGEPAFVKKDDDFVTHFLPAELTTKRDYYRALFIYVAFLVSVLVVLSLVGPSPLAALGITKAPNAPDALPIFLALLIVGLLPNTPVIRGLELSIRKFAQARAFIPQKARVLLARLAAANFDFTQYSNSTVMHSIWLRGVEAEDFDSDRGTLEYSWARLSCLLYAIDNRRTSGSVDEYDSDLMDKYELEFERIKLHKKAIEADFVDYRGRKASDVTYNDNNLHDEIKKTVRALYVLLGCSVLVKSQPNADLNAVFAKFGLLLAPPSKIPGNTGIAIVGLSVMTISVFLLVFAAANIAAIWNWHKSELFPVKPLDPYVYAVSALLAQGTAIFTANAVRTWLFPGRWLQNGKRRDPVKYVMVGIVCAVVGYVVLLGWAFVIDRPSLSLAISTLPQAILPAVTGIFFAVNLDTVYLQQTPPAWMEIGIQGAATGFCSYVTTESWMTLIGKTGNDYLVLMILIGVCIGCLLGWYIPRAARRRYDPSAETKEAWSFAAETNAKKILKDDTAANFWLGNSLDEFGGRSPKTAIVDRATFEAGMKLLRSLGAQSKFRLSQ